MMTVLLIACIGMIAGSFILLGLTPMAFTTAIFGRLTDQPKALRDETHRRAFCVGPELCTPPKICPANWER